MHYQIQIQDYQRSLANLCFSAYSHFAGRQWGSVSAAHTLRTVTSIFLRNVREHDMSDRIRVGRLWVFTDLLDCPSEYHLESHCQQVN